MAFSYLNITKKHMKQPWLVYENNKLLEQLRRTLQNADGPALIFDNICRTDTENTLYFALTCLMRVFM